WRKPGCVTSRVLTAPPPTAARSTTATFQPLAERCTAAASPLTPEPMTIASWGICSLLRRSFRRCVFPLVPRRAGTQRPALAPGFPLARERAEDFHAAAHGRLPAQ